MDMTTIIGLILGLGGIVIGNMIEGGETASLVQGAAAVIVLSGTLGAVLVSNKRRDINKAVKYTKEAFKKETSGAAEKALSEIVDCARIARKESILTLEPKLSSMSHPFLQNVMRTVVDGIDPAIIRNIFENQIHVEEEQELAAAKVWNDAGGFSPTIGIIGAVLGLIHVMGNLTDTSKLGTGIAVAFVATIYGVGFANLIFIPIGNKLKRKAADNTKIKQMILEGGLCIQAGMTPGLTDIKLRPYIEKE